MKPYFLTLTLSILAALTAALPLQAAPPEVSNVRASQRAGTRLVDIFYDLADPDSDFVSVHVLVSRDGGETFPYSALTLDGNGFGPDVSPGSDKQVIWDAGIDWTPDLYTQVRVKIMALDSPDETPPTGMVYIPEGTFMMGEDDTLIGNGDERPVHEVFISGFYMDRFEVTKSHWDRVANWASSNGYPNLEGSGNGPDHPVVNVSWFDAIVWANARSEMEGKRPVYFRDQELLLVYRSASNLPFVDWNAEGYRLPTEAEWEKAARGGLEGHVFPWPSAGADVDHLINEGMANYLSDTSVPVGNYPPNGYGLHDMAGNVLEWCWDWYDSGYYSNNAATADDPTGPGSGSHRVYRGGGWTLSATYLRVAVRAGRTPTNRGSRLGFRLVSGQPQVE